MPETDSLIQVKFLLPDTTAPEITFYKKSKEELIHLSENGVFVKTERSTNDGFEFTRYDASERLWIPGVLFSVVIIFIISRVAYHHKYRQLLQSLLASRYMKLAMREERALNHPFSVLLTVNYSLICGLLIYIVLGYFQISAGQVEGILLFILLSGIILVLLLAKTIVKRLVQFIIGEDAGQSEDRFNMYYFNQALGIALIPPVIISFFTRGDLQEAAIWFSCALVVLFYLVRLGRGVIVGIASGSSAIYLFLYLCTLEITPLIVMMRVLVSEIG